MIRKFSKGIFLLALFIGILGVNKISFSTFSQQTLPPLPKLWQIIWADNVSAEHLTELKNQGFDGLFKCVAYSPNYPNSPIYAGAEWRLVERIQGQYDWSSLETCLNNALQANMWFIPDIVINVPPDWLLSQYPDALLKDSRGITITDPEIEGGPYLLSPWFIETGLADLYLESFINSFLSVVSQYPNVPAVMIGNFKLNNLPWKMGTNRVDDYTYWPIWDSYAVASYRAQFGASANPPISWNDYLFMSITEKSAFRNWLIMAISNNLRFRYLPWLSNFEGWKILNASIWDNNGVQNSVFTTTTPEMAVLKQNAIAASGIEGVIVNDDNMGDCGLSQFHQSDIDLAHSNGFLIYGERVPGVCGWSGIFSMWQNFTPVPDGFINIREADNYWAGQFRLLYGDPIEPLPHNVFIPIAVR